MNTFSQLAQAVSDAARSGRIGQPVFVRCLSSVPDAASDPAGTLAGLLQTVRGWLDTAVDRVYAIASTDRSQATVTVHFSNGATALLATLAPAAAAPHLDLMVLGNHGAIYYEGFTGATVAAARFDSVDERWRAVVEQSLRSGSPEQGSRESSRSLPPASAAATAARPLASRSRYGVLLVTGAHTHQENYARAFAADSRCRLVALSDELSISSRRRELNERLARELDLPYIADLDEALAREDVAIVSLCAEPERRGRVAVRCARAGKHLYLDKSLAPRLEEADAIVAAVRERGLRSHMYSFITQPWARQAKEWLDSGRLGTLAAIHLDIHFAKGRAGTARLNTPRQEQYPPDPRSFQQVEAKREMDNVAVYAVSLARWLSGQEFRQVHCGTANYFFQEHQQHDVEDFAVLALTAANGLPVTISAGRIGWTSHAAAGNSRIVLAGTQATLLADANRPRLEIHDDRTPWVPPPVNPTDPMGFWKSTQEEVHTQPKPGWAPINPVANDARYFLDCLDQQRDSEISAADAAATTEVLLAGYQSAATGQVITLPLPRH